VSANYFDVTGIEIVRGRAFTDAEVAAEQPAAVILTESTARSFWPGMDPLGQTLIFAGFTERSLEVVGIARDVEVTTIGETDTSYLYLPATPSAQNAMQLVIRTALPAESLREPIAAVFERLDPLLPVRVQPLAANFEIWARLSGLAASLAFGLGTLALVLASVGVFGVMSTVVAGRVREIGVRVAVGAGGRDVLALVLKKSMLPVAIGAAVGALACFGATRLLSSLLFGVGALDPYALVGAAAAVLGAAFLASAIPARRAMSVDPMAALRYE
jgi:ABC-type antimicrobial peptide transport system permease subunit